MYQISYVKDGERFETRFPKELIEVMIKQINDISTKVCELSRLNKKSLLYVEAFSL